MIETKLTFSFPMPLAPSGLRITVLYTTVRPTLTALRHAATLARDLGASIRVLNVRAVPYPLPLDRPPVDHETLARNFRTIAEGQAIPTRVEVCYGRDVVESLLHSLSPNSIVLIGEKLRWWPSRERRWAKLLSRHGHHIVLVPVDSKS